MTTQPLPATEPLPAVDDKKARRRSINAYVEQRTEMKQTVFDHKVDHTSGLWGLSDRERFYAYEAGPRLDEQRLTKAALLEQEQAGQYQQMVEAQQMAQLSNGHTKPEELLPPAPLLSDGERVRLAAYQSGVAREVAWAQALIQVQPSFGIRVARDMASLRRKFGI